MTQVGVTCTIDWMRRDASYVSYVTALCLVVFVVPLVIAIVLYVHVYNSLRHKRINKFTWAKKGWEGTVMLGCCLTTYIAFSGYAIVVLWPFIADPKNIPKAIHVLPAPMGKLAGLINPIFYIWLNPRLCASIKRMLGLSYDASLVQPIAGEEMIWIDNGQLSVRSKDEHRAGGLDLAENSPLTLAHIEA
uniref:G-protein coupled receptors family 1 profile domain-containing protein n=1 Tax=Plectus sambesii TaxID=2011161 RepID=A0A914UZ27_9BILA